MEKPNSSKTPQSASKAEAKTSLSKRKLFGAAGSSTPADEDKRSTPKRRKSGGEAGASAAPPTTKSTPSRLSERQQMALLMQMTAESSTSESPKPSPQTTPSGRKPSSSSAASSSSGSAYRKANKRNERGEAPLHLAAIRGDGKQCRKLIKAGADVNARDFAGWSALHEACNHGWFDVAKILLRAGANANSAGGDDDTPLHDAAMNGHRRLVAVLIRHGADAMQHNAHGKTPIDVAASSEIVACLRREVASSSSDDYSADDASLTPSESSDAETEKEMTPDPAAAAVAAGESLKPGGAVVGNRGDGTQLPAITSSRKPYGSAAACGAAVQQQQQQQQKPYEKATSPRLTMKFQSIKTREEKPSTPSYQSYSVVVGSSEQRQQVASSPDSELSEAAAAVSSSREPATKPLVTHEKLSTTGQSVVSSSDENDRAAAAAAAAAGQYGGAPAAPPIDDARGAPLQQPPEAPADLYKFESDEEGPTYDLRKVKTAPAAPASPDDGSSSTEVEGSATPAGAQPYDEMAEERAIGAVPGAAVIGGVLAQTTTVDGRYIELGKASVVLEKVSPGSMADVSPSSLNGASYLPAGMIAGEAGGEGALMRVPPLKIIMPGSVEGGGGGQEEVDRFAQSKQSLPYILGADAASAGSPKPDSTADNNSRDAFSSACSSVTKAEEQERRVTRSSQRIQQAAAANAQAAAVVAMDNNSANDSVCTRSQKSEQASVADDTESTENMHPRKRKMRQREREQREKEAAAAPAAPPVPDADADAEPEVEPPLQPQVHIFHRQEEKQPNCYQLYLNIRKKVEQRRAVLMMTTVTLSLPHGFKDYLMNKCSYILQGNAASRISVPMMTPPQSLTPPMRELFVELEKQRYRLRLQHVIEKEKLMLAVEQEILRVHSRAARAVANQTIPFSLCSILKDEEVYNFFEEEHMMKLISSQGDLEGDGNLRNRYNGRQLRSWLNSVDEKYAKVKENLLLRHHNEAESLHAVQQMEWLSKLRDTGLDDSKNSSDVTQQVDQLHVPMVHVSDDFDLLPA